MSPPTCLISELPDDLQVLICELVEDSLGVAGLRQIQSRRFTIHRIDISAFPRVKMWTDYRDRAYSEAMIGKSVPPILICGEHWLDGRNRVWAAQQAGKTTVNAIDLAEIGVTVCFEQLGRLFRPTPPRA